MKEVSSMVKRWGDDDFQLHLPSSSPFFTTRMWIF